MIFAMSVLGGVVLFWTANVLAGASIFLVTVIIDFIREHTKAYRSGQDAIAVSEDKKAHASTNQDPFER